MSKKIYHSYSENFLWNVFDFHCSLSYITMPYFIKCLTIICKLMFLYPCKFNIISNNIWTFNTFRSGLELLLLMVLVFQWKPHLCLLDSDVFLDLTFCLPYQSTSECGLRSILPFEDALNIGKTSDCSRCGIKKKTKTQFHQKVAKISIMGVEFLRILFFFIYCVTNILAEFWPDPQFAATFLCQLLYSSKNVYPVQ